MKFKHWLIESEVSDYDKVKNYALNLAKEPRVHLDDAITLLNVLKRNLKRFDPDTRFNAFSDYQYLIRQVFDKLSTEDRADADKALHNMFDDDTFQHPMAVHGHTSPTIDVRKLEDIMHTIMERDFDPVIVKRFWDKYKDVYKNVSENLKREFVSWFQNKIRRMGDVKSLADILKDLFKEMEAEDSF
jgi:hypothetical protein